MSGSLTPSPPFPPPSVLLQYLDVANPSPAVRRWNADRCSTLQSTALSALHQLAPLSTEQYVSCGGIATVLALMAHSEKPSHVEATLRHLHALCSASADVAEELGAAGATGVLMQLVQERPGWPEGARLAALLMLSALCSASAENQRRLRKAEGVAVLVAQLSLACALDPSLPSPFALAVLDAIWSCVVPDRKNVAKFLVADGMDLLLNLLERSHKVRSLKPAPDRHFPPPTSTTSHKAHRPLALSVLADLLENSRAVPFFHEWRSDLNQQAAAHLLIGFWKVRILEGVIGGCMLRSEGMNVQSSFLELESRWAHHHRSV